MNIRYPHELSNDDSDGGDDDWNAIVIGTRFTVDFCNVMEGGKPYTIQDLRRALTKNTTLVDLTINFDGFRGFPHLNQDFIQFLLQYIFTRNHLRKLTLQQDAPERFGGFLNVVRQFLLAVAQSGAIHSLRLDMRSLSVQALVEFCRANRNIKILNIHNVDLASDETNNLDPARKHFPLTALDLLEWNYCTVSDLPAALVLTDLFQRLNITSLRLGFVGGVVARSVAALMKSPVKRLELLWNCCMRAYRTALTAGTAAVEQLSVEVAEFQNGGEKFNLLEKTIRAMQELKVLHVRIRLPLPRDAKRRFFQAVDGCTTLTEIQVHDQSNNFSPGELQLLQGGRVEQRNNNLRRFVATPSDPSERDLLKLMLQLENCPTGLYQLVRALPSEDGEKISSSPDETPFELGLDDGVEFDVRPGQGVPYYAKYWETYPCTLYPVPY